MKSFVKYSDLGWTEICILLLGWGLLLLYPVAWPTLISTKYHNLHQYWGREYINGLLQVQGVPKKMWFKPIIDFLTLEGVFLRVKNNSKNFGNKKNIGLYSKILSKSAFFIRKMQKILIFYEFMAMLRMENIFRYYKSKYLCI